jgi:hypothetical protein
MIGIEVNGTFLELKEESFRLEKINTSFYPEVFQGDYSFPCSVDDTEINRKTLGFPTSLENADRVLKVHCYLWLGGVPYNKAMLHIIGASNNKIKFNIAGGLKSLTIFDKSLKELDYGTDYDLGVDSDAIIASAKTISLETDFSVYGFSFVPHKNEDFYNGENPDFCGIINRQNSTTGDFLKNTFVTGNKYALVPFVYLFYILDTIFKSESLEAEGDFYTDPEMRRMLLYNNYALDKSTNEDNAYVFTNEDYIIFGSSYSVYAFQNIKFLNNVPGAFDESAAWDNLTNEYTIQAPGTIDILAQLDVFIPYDVDWYDCGVYELQFAVYANGVLITDGKIPANSHGLKHLVISTTYVAGGGDVGSKILIKYKLGVISIPPSGFNITIKGSSNLLIANDAEQLNIFERTVSIKNHVKDITVAEFLATLKTIGVAIDFDYIEGKVKLYYDGNIIKNTDRIDYTDKVVGDFENNFEEQNKGFLVKYNFGSENKLVENNFKKYPSYNFKGSVNSFDELPIPIKLGNVILVKSSSQLYITKINTGGSGYVWGFFSDNYYELKIGEGLSEFNILLTPMFMDFAENEGGTSDENKCLIPVSKQHGTTQMYAIGENDYGLSFVFLRGLNSGAGVASPKGGLYIYASSTNIGINGNTTGDYNCTLDTEEGVFRRYLYDILIILNTAEYLERGLNFNEKDIMNFNIKRKVEIDGISYLVKNLTADFKQLFTTVKAVFLKI